MPDAKDRRPTKTREAHERPIMIVDDLPEMRAILAEVLEDAGFTTITARNGEEAWRVLAEGLAPRAILLDLVMPVVDGWQFLRAARPAAPVILMSGVIANVPADLPACVVATLEKPVDISALLETLHRTVTAPLSDAQHHASTSGATAARSRQ